MPVEDPPAEPVPRRMELHLLRDVHAARKARAWLGEELSDIDGDLAYEATLVLSELVTNGVRHTLSPAIDITAIVGEELLRVEVADDASGPSRPEVGDNGRDDGGRGLREVVSGYADDWGAECGADRTMVWFVMKLGQ